MFRRNRLILLTLVLLIETTPFLLAAGAWGPDWVFGGFLANPIDGATYLAKMQEGWSGGWKFTVLYSPQPSGGAYAFLLYLLLGHLARWMGVSLLIVFHAARVLATVLMVMALARFSDSIFGDDTTGADRSLWLVLLGTGMGWLFLLFTGEPGADFWVVEGYPFLSLFANVHFPLGLALILWMAVLDWRGQDLALWKRCLGLALLGGLLAAVQPFGLVVAVLPLCGSLLYRWLYEKRFMPWNALAGMAVGVPYLLYLLWAFRVDPVLTAWNAQNLTPAPGLADTILSQSPALAAAVIGVYKVAHKRAPAPAASLAFWLVAGLVLIYLPFGLQRRFMTGIYVPVVFLAVYAIREIEKRWTKAKPLYFLVAIFSLLTSGLYLLTIFSAPRLSDPRNTGLSGATAIYFPAPALDAMDWLRSYAPLDAVVLAEPDWGVYVPAWSGRRTVYGHPFETPHAEKQLGAVRTFFSGEMSVDEADFFLRENRVDYILTKKSDLPVEGGQTVFDVKGILILKVKR